MKELEQGLGTGRTGQGWATAKSKGELNTGVTSYSWYTDVQNNGKRETAASILVDKARKSLESTFFFFFSNKNTSSFVNSILRLVLRRNYIVFKMP